MNKTSLSSLENFQGQGKAVKEGLAYGAVNRLKSKTWPNARREARAEALFSLFGQQRP
ncbi:hypothetical protein SG34_031030 [Thalassomonas viridans]|uniref:Uncharacterized protein n=1 Tax=Thalassomonas viridans TaxID=137584 RepID=A0AAE9ZBU0_9GAMM|nr:hypothetical protein [Thalassomonas viridans]WDE09200.1 hypothetical protein SG34_031030 [Thalassomonas viridans]